MNARNFPLSGNVNWIIIYRTINIYMTATFLRSQGGLYFLQGINRKETKKKVRDQKNYIEFPIKNSN